MFTRFGGYSSVFGSGYTTSIDVYLDVAWAIGTGFDFSSAINNQLGVHRRDFIWHVGVTAAGLLVNGSNNTDFAFNDFKLTNPNGGDFATILTSGWYTLQNVFRDEGGALAVDYNLLDSSGSLVNTFTRSDPTDLTSTVVGGNRYGWFTYSNVDNLAVDNTRVVGAKRVSDTGSTGALLGLALLGFLTAKRRLKR